MLNHLEDNEARIVGNAIGDAEFNHNVGEEEFYSFSVAVSRLSENVDTIVVTAPKRLVDEMGGVRGKKLEICGQFRSYNNYSEKGNRLILTLFAREMRNAEEEEFDNEIYLNGFLCKAPVYRVTPFGREIADILLAVNRAYNKSDYIPCIAWGRNARIVKNMKVGQNIKIYGRMQSREYQKKLSESETITKTAYEVSVNQLEAVDII